MKQPTYVQENENLNPFFSIWFSTRKTIRYALENKSLKYALILTAISGIPNGFNAFGELSSELNIHLWVLILGSIILGPLLSLLGLGISTVVLTYVGKWLGGVGTLKEMAKTMGITTIPTIWLSPFFILSSIFTYNGIFQLDSPSGFTSGAVIWMILSSLILFGFGIWMIILQSQAIGEVHQFSSLRGFGTLIIPSVVLFIILFIVLMVFFTAVVI
ncbi:MAG: YIP1 family protein [Paenisporosarcina sp.]